MDIFPKYDRDRAISQLDAVGCDSATTMAWIEGFSANSRHPTEDICDAFVKLAAAGTDPRAGALKILADTARALCVPLPAIANPIADSLTRGRLSWEDTMQLISCGLPNRILESAAGSTLKKLKSDIVESDGIPRSVIEALIVEMGKEFSTQLHTNTQHREQGQAWQRREPAEMFLVDDFLIELHNPVDAIGLVINAAASNTDGEVSARVLISSHRVRYKKNEGLVDYPCDTISGLKPDTYYYILSDEGARRNEPTRYFAVTALEDVMDLPRHRLLGKIKTPG